MTEMMRGLSVAASVLALSAAASAQEASFGGQTGPDLSIEAIQPRDEAVAVGMAGEDPADIGRYLLAEGIGAAQLSPDGGTVLFSWGVTGESQLWTMPSEGGQPKRLTYGSGLSFARWLPDGSGILYGADNDGNEQEAFYLISADGSEERLVLPAAEGGFRSFGDFAADGSAFIYGSTERDGLSFDIWRADLDGEAEMIFEGRLGFYPRSISPDGRYALITESVGEDSDNLYLLDLETRELETLYRPDPRANHGDAGFTWARDGSGFYYATNRDRIFSAVEFFDMETRESRVIAESGVDVGDIALCGANGRYLAWTLNRDGFHELKIRDLNRNRDIDAPDLPGGVYSLSCADQANRLAVRVSNWETPGDLYRINLPRGGAERVFEADLAGLDPARLVRPESIRITARDGVELQGLLYVPDEASRNGEPAPVVFNVHGGPTAQSQAGWSGTTQYLVDRGIAVFAPNVRGSTGFGRVYVTLDDRENRLDSVRDLVDMLEALEDDPRLDTSRAAVRGGSYGGYMVNAVLAAYPGVFDAGVSLFGVADWVTALEIASPGLKAADLIEYGDIGDERWRAFYTQISPIAQAGRIDVPVLYSHGVNDPRVDIGETETMVRILRENGVEAPFIRIPDEGHGWRKLSNQLFYFRREAEFLERVLQEDGAAQ